MRDPQRVSLFEHGLPRSPRSRRGLGTARPCKVSLGLSCLAGAGLSQDADFVAGAAFCSHGHQNS